jgi:hypothetical protein
VGDKWKGAVSLANALFWAMISRLKIAMQAGLFAKRIQTDKSKRRNTRFPSTE